MTDLNSEFKEKTQFYPFFGDNPILIFSQKKTNRFFFNFRNSLPNNRHNSICNINRLKPQIELPKCYYFSSGLSNPNGYY